MTIFTPFWRHNKWKHQWCHPERYRRILCSEECQDPSVFPPSGWQRGWKTVHRLL